jgi:RHS repeat-associated protein
MGKKTGFLSGFFSLLAQTLFLLVFPGLVQAKYIGADPPYCCQCANRGPCPEVSNGSAISLTEGNQRSRYSVSSIRSAFGSTINFSLVYNSYNADGSRAQIDTVMGYGWTHSYNLFLFNQRGSMFRMDDQGRVTKYQLGAGGTFTAAPGYFETLVKNPDGSFTLRQKDGTVFHFASIPNTPFLVGGPVYRVTSITDRNNNTITLLYDGAGRLTSVTDTYGRSLTLSYSTQNKLTGVTDPLGRTTTFAYDATGRQLLQITDPENKITQYSYNFLYQITQKIDKDGRVFTYVYNSQNKPVAIKDGASANLFNLTNPNNWATDDNQLALNLVRVYLPSTTSKTDGRGNVWRYDYDSRGYITRVTAPDGAITRYTYDPTTLMVASMTDANNHTTSYQYDSNGNMTQKTDANGNVTAYTYEPIFSQMTSMTDPNNRVTAYQYDAFGDRIQAVDPLGQMQKWTYDSHGNVLTETDKRGNSSAYVYDTSGNRITATDAVGLPEQRETNYTYDAVGNLTSRTDANSHTRTYQYDGLDRLTKETDPTGKFTQSFYDGQGDRTQVIDRDNNSTSYQYDLRQRLVKAADALNQNVMQNYDGNDNRISTTDRNNHTTSYQYDVQNRLITVTDAVGNVFSMTYDGVGNKLTETDANNHTTTYQYDALNRMTQRTDAELFVTRLAYDPGAMVCAECTGPTKGSGLITKQTDGNGKVTYFKYEGLDRLIFQIRKEGDAADVIDASDAVTEYFYDANDNRIQVIEPNTNATVYQYDALNRQTLEMNAAGDTTLTTYDGVNNVTTVTAPNLNVIAYSYDALDRVVQVDDSVGRAVNYTYDNVGNRLTEKDGNGNGTTYTYDVIYRMTDVTDALGKTTHYGYDPVGNLLTLTDRETNVTTHVYDNINRRTQMTDALGNITQYQYDGVGNLTRLIDANLHATSYNYDKINRLIKETYPDGQLRTFAYDAVNLTSRTDQNGQTTNYIYNDLYFLLQRSYPVSPADNMTYDLSGRMLAAERGGWLVTFQYDGANRVIQTTQNGQPIAYLYNVPGRTNTLTYPGGRVIIEEMDFRDRLDHIDDGLMLPVVQYTYDPGNRLATRTYRNGTTAVYTYNNNDWVTGLDHSIGVTRVAGFGHDYDNEGNKRFEQKSPDGANSQTRSEAYQYDKIYRLIDFKVGTLVGSTVPVPTTQTQYGLDPVGNWNVKTKDGVPENRTHNVTNEITTINAAPLAYDNNGNLIEDTVYRYAYDEENRLTSVTRKSDNRLVGQYLYDALSRRVRKIADPGTISSPVETRYFYDDARIIEEQNTSTVTQATYVYGNYVDEVLTMDRGGQSFYYHQNTLWSVEAVTDDFANVVERYSYDAYGLPTVLNGSGVPLPLNSWGTPHSAIGNPWMFTGRQFDEETGLFFYRARYYDAVKGRFIQRDPMGYINGRNLYQYVGSGPTRSLDSYGLELRIGNIVINANSDFYKRMAVNDTYKQILDKMINAEINNKKVLFTRPSEDYLAQELEMREEFIACMVRHARQGAGCTYGPAEKTPSTSAKFPGLSGTSYKGDKPSEALTVLENGPTVLDCYTMGYLCMWIALRNTLGGEEFDERFKGKLINITRSISQNKAPGGGTIFTDVPLRLPNQSALEARVELPGDFVQFFNVPDYGTTRPSGNYRSENAVYQGIIGGQDKYCGFGMRPAMTREEIWQELVDDYNAGHRDALKEGFKPKTIADVDKKRTNIRRPNPNFPLP